MPRPIEAPRLERIKAEATRPLRQRVLRPHQQASELVFEGDDDPESLHLGVFEGEALLGVASIYPQPSEALPPEGAWRLRGMAVVPERQGQGLGAMVLHGCLEHAAAHGGRLVWCNARTTAADFYARHGFERMGEAFELPHIGPHYLMARRLRLENDEP